MTSLEQNFRNLRKESSQIFAMIMWSKFHKNRPKLWLLETRTDRQTDRQTDAQTGLILRVKIFSSEMTEYKKQDHTMLLPLKVRLSDTLSPISSFYFFKKFYYLHSENILEPTPFVNHLIHTDNKSADSHICQTPLFLASHVW